MKAVQLLTIALLFGSPAAGWCSTKEKASPESVLPAFQDSVSPLVALHKAWEARCSKDLGKQASVLTELAGQLRTMVPQDAAHPSIEAVEKAWELRPKVIDAWDALAASLRRYNEMAWNWGAPKGQPNRGEDDSGVIDALYLPALPMGSERWESLRPLVLPLSPTAEEQAAAPWDERARVKQRREATKTGTGLNTLGWDDPEGDGSDWKSRAGRWAYDFALLHRWLAMPPDELQPRLRADWLAREGGVAAGKAWAAAPPVRTIKLFRGQYEWREASPLPNASSLATRPATVARLLSPAPAADSAGTLAGLQAKHAVLETLARTVVDAVGGPNHAPHAAEWLDNGGRTSPPWTILEPKLVDKRVRAMAGRATYAAPQAATALACQFVGQVNEFQVDGTWTPAPQGWSGLVPIPPKPLAPDDGTVPGPVPDPIITPSDLDAAWPEVCEWAAAETGGKLAGRSARVLSPSTEGWWFAFPAETLGAALTARGLSVAETGVPVQCVFRAIKEHEGAEVVLLIDGAEVVRRAVSLPAPWPSTWASRRWQLWPWLSGMTAACLIVLLRRKRQSRLRVDSWWRFLSTEPFATTLLLALLGSVGALVLSLLGPSIEEHPVSLTGVTRVVLPAHRGVPEGIRALCRRAVEETFRRLTGGTVQESWSTRFWRTVRCGLYLEPPSRPSMAAQDAMWQLVPTADGGTQTIQQGLLRAQNAGDLARTLAAWRFDGLGPSELKSPGAGASVTLLCSDGDHGAMRPEQPTPVSTEPVVTLWMPDPPRDPRPEVAVRLEECSARLVTASTVCVSAMQTALPGLTQLPSAISAPEPIWPAAASAAPEDVQARRDAWWNGSTTTQLETLGRETADVVAHEATRHQSSRGGPSRLTNRLSGVRGWVLMALATIGVGAVGARTVNRARALLDQVFREKKHGRTRLWPSMLLAGVLLVTVFGLAALAAATLEPLLLPWGLPVQALTRLAPLTTLVLLTSSIIIYLMTRGSALPGASLRQSLNVPRFVAAIGGAIVISATVAWVIIMPSRIPGGGWLAPHSFSAALAFLTAAWLAGLSLLAFAASARSPVSRRR